VRADNGEKVGLIDLRPSAIVAVVISRLMSKLGRRDWAAILSTTPGECMNDLPEWRVHRVSPVVGKAYLHADHESSP
jgi:hypothetical protein